MKIVAINLHYANNTLIFGKLFLAMAIILTWTLLCYKKWLGHQINFHKSALIFLGKILTNSILLTFILNCSTQRLSIIYLGLPLIIRRLIKPQWIPLIEKVQKKLVGWKGRMLSMRERITIINASSLPSQCISSLSSRSQDEWKGWLDLCEENFCGTTYIEKGKAFSK